MELLLLFYTQRRSARDGKGLPTAPALPSALIPSGRDIRSAGNGKKEVMERQKAGKRRGNADWHVSMGAQERFGVKESCIIEAGQWEGRDEMFKGSVLATAE